LALQAYLAPSTENESKLQAIRSVLGERLTVASTLGFGPRFLHSTGQLHKGGANNGLFLQFVDEPQQDMPVPETDFTFGELLAAQALGDFRALKQRDRRVLRINLGVDAGLGLDAVQEALG
jgi:transaldolase/glucose-6-phosphate isomerase